MTTKVANKQPSSEPVLTPEDIAARLKVDVRTVTRLMDSGRLKCINVGTGQNKHRRTSEEWYQAYLHAGGK